MLYIKLLSQEFMHFIAYGFARTTLLVILPFASYAADSVYCPQNHAYINVGMTQDQVIASCGRPTSIQAASDSVVQQIPVTQLIYSTLNQGAVYFYPGINPLYNMWSLPSGSQGTSLEVDLINNQITSMKINGSDTNALSMCQGGTVQIGDDINAIYNACGAPSTINNTYINKVVSGSARPQVWTYSNEYQPSIVLTFTNGILQSIN